MNATDADIEVDGRYVRGRGAKTLIGLTFLSHIFWLGSSIYSQHHDRLYGVSVTLWAATGIFIVSCACLFQVRRSFRAILLVGAIATVTTAASEWLLPRLDETQLLRSGNGFAMFASSQTLGSLFLLALATLAIGNSPAAKPKPRWWPVALSFGLAVSLSAIQSSLTPENWTTSINRTLGALVVGLLAFSVLVAMARPQLSLAFSLIYLALFIRYTFVGTFSNSGLLQRLWRAPLIFAVAALLIGWQTAKRSLRA